MNSKMLLLAAVLFALPFTYAFTTALEKPAHKRTLQKVSIVCPTVGDFHFESVDFGLGGSTCGSWEQIIEKYIVYNNGNCPVNVDIYIRRDYYDSYTGNTTSDYETYTFFQGNHKMYLGQDQLYGNDNNCNGGLDEGEYTTYTRYFDGGTSCGGAIAVK